MSGISSKALTYGGAGNKYKFNGGNELQSNEFSDGGGLEMFDAVNRMYDPQIGRFWQIDEMADAYEDWTPYAFAENNPILKNDPLGLDPEKSTPDNPIVLPEVVIVAIPKGKWARQNLYYDIMDQLNRRGATIDQIMQPSLREMMYRYDGITKFRQKVADGNRADGLAFLNFASWFVPGGILTKLGKLKKLQGLLKLYNTKRGRFAVNSLIQFGINGKNADIGDILLGTFIPGLKGLGIQVALDWKPLGDNGAVPELAFINKDGASVAVDAFTALAYFGLGKLPVTATPLTTTQKNVLSDVYTTLEAAINNIYQQGVQQLESNR
jgi:RHS repeat-associated protein